MELIKKLENWAKRLHHWTHASMGIAEAWPQLVRIANEIEEEATWRKIKKKHGGHSGED